MRYRLRTLLILLAGAWMTAPTVFLAWNQSNKTNCGGNNAALNDVHQYALFIQCAAAESENGEWLISSATVRQREQLAEIATDQWLRGGQLLVSTHSHRLDSVEPRRLVVVCDRSFDNVPRLAFGKVPPTHAAGYSDGSTSLLTAQEFATLDHSSLTSLSSVIQAD